MYLLPPFPDESSWERLALLPCDPLADSDALLRVLECGGREFTRFLVDFDLAAIWHATLAAAGRASQLPASCAGPFRDARMAAAARYLVQLHALHRLERIFSRAGIAYAVMKGAAIREEMLDDPSVLLASDVDVLVAPADRLQAAALLVDGGFAMRLDPVNISHEVGLSMTDADIDLHWHILRPGRTRVELTEELLARRVRRNGFWTLSDMDCTFMMLTHPAFTKHICSPHMGLARVMSFLLWHRRVEAHWEGVARTLQRAGLKTAAWAMLGWYGALAPQSLKADLAQRRECLRPGCARAAYLDFWLRHNLPSRWVDRALPIQAGLITFLHDGPLDVWTAYQGWFAARRHRGEQTSEFEGVGGGST